MGPPPPPSPSQTATTLDFNSQKTFLDAIPVGKRAVHRPAAYEEWDFLKGQGPSAGGLAAGAPITRAQSQPRARFTPHGERWDSRRPVATIAPDKQRAELDAVHEHRRELANTQRLDTLQHWSKYNNFDVVSGADGDPPGTVRERRQRMNYIAPPTGFGGKRAIPIEMRLMARVDGWDSDPRFAVRAASRRELISREGVQAPWRASVRDSFTPT